MRIKQLLTLAFGVLIAATLTACTCDTNDSCVWRGEAYSTGAQVCSSGTKLVCDEGEWEAEGECAELHQGCRHGGKGAHDGKGAHGPGDCANPDCPHAGEKGAEAPEDCPFSKDGQADEA